MTSFDDCLPGELFEDGARVSVRDLSRLLSVEEHHIVELVEEGVITALEIDSTEWRFAGTEVRRARIALRLERDLGVNLPGAALALELLEELEQLRRERRSRP
jgi:chaperone modulatory protein CbpM